MGFMGFMGFMAEGLVSKQEGDMVADPVGGEVGVERLWVFGVSGFWRVASSF